MTTNPSHIASPNDDGTTMATSTPELAGVLPVFQTPFDDDGDVSAPQLESQIDWLFDNGAQGLVFAMVSEVLRLSTAERDLVTSLACKYANGRGPVIISVGTESTHTAIAHARHAQDCGAGAVMATPPHLHAVGDEEVIAYYQAIAASVDIPIIVQDASGYVGAPLAISTQARLFRELEDRVYFKPEADPVGPRLSQLLTATNDGARVFEGTGGIHLIDSYRRGVVGTMPAGDLVWALAALWDALNADNFDQAYRIGGPLAQIVSLQTSLDTFVAIEKHLLVKQGVLSNVRMRAPIGNVPDAETLSEVDRLVQRLRDAVYG